MQRLWFPSRAATAVVAVPLLLGAAVSARAQDGQLPTGDPVTGPKTSRDNPRPDTSTPPRRTTADILPPVPESPSDPAPPGTRGVQIPRPGSAAARAGAPAAPAPGQAPAPAGQPARVHFIEGVVTAIHPADADARSGGTLVRLVIDPDQTWHAFAAEGPQNLEPGGRPSNLSPRNEPDTAGDRVAPAPAPAPRGNPAAPGAPVTPDAAPAPRPGFRSLPQDPAPPPPPAPPTPAPPADPTRAPLTPADAPAPAQVPPTDLAPPTPTAAPSGQPAAIAPPPNGLEVLITRRTRVAVHARSPEGTDLYGVASYSSPDDRPSGTGASPRGLAAPAGPRMTNFTNIRMGSYVSVRYMTIDGVAYALNVNLIELPILGSDAGGRDPGLEPNGAGAGPGRPASRAPATTAPAGPRTERELDREVLERPSDDGPRNPRDPKAPTVPNTPSGPTGPG